MAKSFRKEKLLSLRALLPRQKVVPELKSRDSTRQRESTRRLNAASPRTIVKQKKEGALKTSCVEAILLFID